MPTSILLKFTSLIAFLSASPLILFSQSLSWEWLAPLPEPITNQAVTAAQVDGDWFVYSFAGLDESLNCDGDHLRSYQYNVQTNEWTALADIPDNLGGKIAPGANTIKDKVYIVGGYHLAPNCHETSSAKIHIFDPETNTFLADGAPIPVPIDDQVQAVWRDSLLYVITGWSNTTNVRDVQIYKPSTDEWFSGTPVNNSSSWKVFGGSGVILGDTIYYAGGARSTGSFSATSYFRKGAINPNDPTEITWEGSATSLALGYRMGATIADGKVIWIGGADDTYNFDAMAYNGSGVINPLDRIIVYDPETGQLNHFFGLIPPIMDIRGVADIGNGEFIIAGGMLANQEVTNTVLKISIEHLTNTSVINEFGGNQFRIAPNPVKAVFSVQFEKATTQSLTAQIIDVTGKVRQQFTIEAGTKLFAVNDLSVESGNYWLKLFSDSKAGKAISFVVQE